jgi:hypothetical protein
MTERQHLPNHRLSESFTVECHGLRYVATIARFPDGRLAEIFLSNHKSGSQADANARDSAVVCSRASMVRSGEGKMRTVKTEDSYINPDHWGEVRWKGSPWDVLEQVDAQLRLFGLEVVQTDCDCDCIWKIEKRDRGTAA